MNIWRVQFFNNQGEAISFVNGTYDFVVASEQGDFWYVNQSQYDTTAVCGEGLIGSICECGFGNFVEGYCCNGVLSASSCVAAFCNDGSCNGLETCSSCSNDCGVCTLNNVKQVILIGVDGFQLNHFNEML